MAAKRNLVFILSDQQRYDTLACYGNHWINTPNLNALASRSVVFRNSYVSQAVCTASRGSIMTGLYPHSAGPVLNGMPLPPEVPTIAEMVSADYLCGYLGKWHLGHALIPQHGFTKWVSTEGGPRELPAGHDPRTSDYGEYLIAHGFRPDIQAGAMAGFSAVKRSMLPEQFQMASFLGERAVEFIEASGQQPFVLYVSCSEPHPPFFGPLHEMYDPADLPVGPTFLKKPQGGSLLNQLKADYFLEYLHAAKAPSTDPYMDWALAGQDLTTEPGWQRLRAHYFANVSLVDRMVGKITAALQQTNQTENTAVIFTSDHGEMLGDHGMLDKRSFYEESTRVPLLVSVPWLQGALQGGLQRGQHPIDGNIGHVDLVPTVLDLLDQDAPEHLQGESRLPVLTGDTTLEGNDVFIEWSGTSHGLVDRTMASPEIARLNALSWRSVVSGRWKLNLCAGDQCELFNLDSDPFEETNLFNDPEQAQRVSDLTAHISQWQQRTADNAALPKHP
jgi:arylsulfatase A-like enzyme